MATQLKEAEPFEEAETTQDERDWEAEARVMGWKPEGEFAEGEKPPKGGFKDAQTFVVDGEHKAGLAQKTVEQLQQRLKTLEREARRLREAEQSAHQRGMEEARRQMRDAAQVGDKEAYDEAEKRFDTLQKEQAITGPVDPRLAFAAFREANEWYDLGGQAGATAEERRARAKADQIAERLAAEGYPNSHTPEEFFEKVAEEVRSAIPTLGAETVTPKPKPPVATGGVSRPGAKGGNGAASLPPEAKEQADRFFDMGIYGKRAKTKEEARALYAKDYFAQ